jgi:hypothetical protein
MTDISYWLSLLVASDAPALPVPWVMRLGLTVGWALVLALLGASLGRKLPIAWRRLLSAGLALWVVLPGSLTPDYWLGLAFHAPSLTAMLLCAWGLQRLLFPVGANAVSPLLPVSTAQPGAAAWPGALRWLLVALGYFLLLDTFAVLPVQMYAWGFSPVLLLGLLALALLPWLRGGHAPATLGLRLWAAPAVLLLFAMTRLPTGNVWDALLDPWLWLWLQWQAISLQFQSKRVRSTGGSALP